MCSTYMSRTRYGRAHPGWRGISIQLVFRSALTHQLLLGQRRDQGCARTAELILPYAGVMDATACFVMNVGSGVPQSIHTELDVGAGSVTSAVILGTTIVTSFDHMAMFMMRTTWCQQAGVT